MQEPEKSCRKDTLTADMAAERLCGSECAEMLILNQEASCLAQCQWFFNLVHCHHVKGVVQRGASVTLPQKESKLHPAFCHSGQANPAQGCACCQAECEGKTGVLE